MLGVPKLHHTLNSSNFSYCLKCPCGKAYRPVRIRLNEHRFSIRLYHSKVQREQGKADGTGHKIKKIGETTVARHFYECYLRVSGHMEVMRSRYS